MSTLRPLSTAQRAAADALVVGGQLRTAPVDEAKAQSFLMQAAEELAAVPAITSLAVKFDVAYNASHDIGEAMLAAYGYRTANGPGAHVAVGAFLRAIFDTPPGSTAAANYDSTRAARNGLRYQARSPSRAGGGKHCRDGGAGAAARREGAVHLIRHGWGPREAVGRSG